MTNPSPHPVPPFDPSLARRGLDELLARYPHLDLVRVDWQLPDPETSSIVSPWLLVELGQPSDGFEKTPAWAIWHFAIWRSTGAVYVMRDGAVDDDPILVVP